MSTYRKAACFFFPLTTQSKQTDKTSRLNYIQLLFNQADKHDDDPEDRLNLSGSTGVDFYLVHFKAFSHDNNNPYVTPVIIMMDKVMSVAWITLYVKHRNMRCLTQSNRYGTPILVSRNQVDPWRFLTQSLINMVSSSHLILTDRSATCRLSLAYRESHQGFVVLKIFEMLCVVDV